MLVLCASDSKAGLKQKPFCLRLRGLADDAYIKIYADGTHIRVGIDADDNIQVDRIDEEEYWVNTGVEPIGKPLIRSGRGRPPKTTS